MAEQPPAATDTTAIGDPTDRTQRDGAAGRGDRLGGTGAGAGDRLGSDQGVERGGVTVPMSGEGLGIEGQTVAAEDEGDTGQHDLDSEEPRTDAAQHYHGMDSPP